MTEQLQHPITQETVEQAARRFLRVATSPGTTADPGLASHAAHRLSVRSPTEAERLFYAAVSTRLLGGLNGYHR